MTTRRENAKRIAALDKAMRKNARAGKIRPALETADLADLKRLANYNRLMIGYVGGRRYEFEDCLAGYYASVAAVTRR